MISNSQSQSSSKKRQREDSEDDNEGEKLSKMEQSEINMKSGDNTDNFKSPLIENEMSIAEVSSTVYRSFNRNVYLDVIWKTEVPKNKFQNNFLLQEKLNNREQIEYNMALLNVFYSGSRSSSLVFAFQNGRGLSDEDFEEELKKIEEILLANDTKATPSNGKLTQNGISNKITDSEMKEKSSKILDDIVIDLTEDENLKTSQGMVSMEESQVKSEGIENIENEQMSVNNSESQAFESNSAKSSVTSESDTSLAVSLNSQKTYSQQSSKSPQSQTTMTVMNNQPSYLTIDKIISTAKKESLKGAYYDSENRPTGDEDIGYVPTYDVSLSLTVVNHKTLDFSFKEIRQGELIIREIPINTFFFTNNLQKEDPKIVVEILMKKNYNFETGFTGIVNEAMTCYMNSMLQTLNVLGYFKRAVFQIPIGNEENSSKSVAYSLQRLFYDLMNENEAVSTNRLIKSFGWSDEQIFVQHDVQEFNLLLCDIMENSMKGTKAEGTFKYLFEGKILNYIECLDVDYRSNKVEPFCDLQLTVKGCKNIYESLNRYTEEEILDNEDKYFTEEHGRQKAKKGIKFISFPNVLIMQLKRFEYNPRKDQMDKINDSFQFYEEIDLSPYIAEDSEYSNCDVKYSLHSVVVHKGGIHSGHYYAYIRPYADHEWYQFNDENVREADYDEVFTYNYGGSLEMFKHRDRGLVSRINARSDSSAYILVYIRNSMRETILRNVTNTDIPEEIKSMIEKDKEEEKRQELMRLREANNVNVFLIAKQNILNHTDLGILPSLLDINSGPNLVDINRTYFNLPKELPIKDFINFVSDQTNIPAKFLMLFSYYLPDPNKIIRRHEFKMLHIGAQMIENSKMTDIFSLYDRKNKFRNKQLWLYVDSLLPKEEVSVLKLNPYGENLTNFEEVEYVVENEEKSVIYIPVQNKFSFHKNNINWNEVNSIFNKKEQEESPNYKLLCLKYFATENDMPTLKIDELIPIEYKSEMDVNSYIRNLRNYKEIYKKYLGENVYNNIAQECDEIEISFVLEKSSGDFQNPSTVRETENANNENINQIHLEEVAPIQNESADISNLMIDDGIKVKSNKNEEVEEESDFTMKVEDISEVVNYNDDTDLLIFIVNLTFKKTGVNKDSLYKVIDSTCTNLFNKVYVNIEYLGDNGKRILINIPSANPPMFKFSFDLSEDSESISKKLLTILNYDANMIKFLLKEKLEMFYLDTQKRLLTQDEFINEIRKDNLLILKGNRNYPNSVAQDIEKYALLQYIGATRSNSSEPRRLLFKIKEMKDEEDEEFETQSLVLFDFDNNPMVRVSMALPNYLKTCEEILNYIYEAICMRFYPEVPCTNFYFMIQHSQNTFAYEIFTEKSSDLTQYENNRELSLEYRLQPYLDEQIDCFCIPERFIKLFVALVSKEGGSACDPFIVYLSKESTVREVKNTIIDKMKKIKKLQNNYLEISLQKVKFYTYSLLNYRPAKDILLLNSKDEDCIMNFFKNPGGAYNLLVEFLVSVQDRDTNNPCATSFLDNGMSLSVDVSFRI